LLRHGGLLELLLVRGVDGGGFLADELRFLDLELVVGLEADFVGLLHGFLADKGRHLLQLSGDLPWRVVLAGAAGAVDVVGGELWRCTALRGWERATGLTWSSERACACDMAAVGFAFAGRGGVARGVLSAWRHWWSLAMMELGVEVPPVDGPSSSGRRLAIAPRASGMPAIMSGR
jgi:hypothetical protein